MGKQRYVVGFMFNEAKTKVALIRKSRPAWQSGLLNGIGGKTEPKEGLAASMIREFKEETGYDTTIEDWKPFCDLTGEDFFIRLYAGIGDLSKLRTVEDEVITIVHIGDLTLDRVDVVENLVWMIGIALNHLENGRPIYTYVHYPKDIA